MNVTNSTISITISGRVQGVWFRGSTKIEAISLGITGFVKNEANGNVYIEATGDTESLDKFVEWCHEGPDLSHVDSVQVNKIGLKNFQTFEVSRK